MAQVRQPLPRVRELHSTRRIVGLTHPFYRYPATTSPDLVRELVLELSNEGDIVLDPFMGGGTTVVEAVAHGRFAIGFDLNPLAVAVTRTKTTPATERDWVALEQWASDPRVFDADHGAGLGDPRVVNLPRSLRRALGGALASLSALQNQEQRQLARCAVMCIAQRSLEGHDNLPDKRVLRTKLAAHVEKMRAGMGDFVASAAAHGFTKRDIRRARRLSCSPAEHATAWAAKAGVRNSVPLVVTSPPYPGVHVLYHRWQVRGRRETAAPFWIAGRRDGFGPAHYTLGGRSALGQELYFDQLRDAYLSVRTLLTGDAVVVQLVAFHNANKQLPLFLRAMSDAGYREIGTVGRPHLTRQVPNRRWYVRGTSNSASREYLLFHSPSRRA